MFQYAVIDRSMIDVSEDRPIFMTRLVDESGWIMNGGAAHVGRLGVTSLTRSATSWRARSRSVPGLNSSSICDSSVTDLERMTSRPGMPAMACSIGTVTSSSTSVADRPRHGTCTSTRGGANSGNASTGVFGSSSRRRPSAPAAAATTR